jgi:hypothetical protein
LKETLGDIFSVDVATIATSAQNMGGTNQVDILHDAELVVVLMRGMAAPPQTLKLNLHPIDEHGNSLFELARPQPMYTRDNRHLSADHKGRCCLAAVACIQYEPWKRVRPMIRRPRQLCQRRSQCTDAKPQNLIKIGLLAIGWSWFIHRTGGPALPVMQVVPVVAPEFLFDKVLPPLPPTLFALQECDSKVWLAWLQNFTQREPRLPTPPKPVQRHRKIGLRGQHFVAGIANTAYTRSYPFICENQQLAARRISGAAGAEEYRY